MIYRLRNGFLTGTDSQWMDGHKYKTWEMDEDVRQLIAEHDHVP